MGTAMSLEPLAPSRAPSCLLQLYQKPGQQHNASRLQSGEEGPGITSELWEQGIRALLVGRIHATGSPSAQGPEMPPAHPMELH